MSVRLSSDEAWEVLAHAHTGILTSLRRDGRPITLPVWFAVLDRRIYVSGPATAKRHARVRRDPRVAFLVDTTGLSRVCTLLAFSRGGHKEEKLDSTRHRDNRSHRPGGVRRAATPWPTAYSKLSR